MFEFLFCVGGFCFILGIGYLACSVLFYPFYKILGGKQKFFDYLGAL